MARKRKQEEEAGAGGSSEASSQPDAASPKGRLTPVEVQQKVFRLAFRGYNERDVDEFLDRITEDLAALHEENKRLKEQIGEGGAGGSAAARAQAEGVVREAREHAARLIEEAESRSAAPGAAPGTAAPSSYLARERDFLQTLASLVQDHARRLKEEARKARPASDEAAGDEVAPPTPPPTVAEQEEPLPSGQEESPSEVAAPQVTEEQPGSDETESTQEGGSQYRAAAMEPSPDEPAAAFEPESEPESSEEDVNKEPSPPESRSIDIPEPETATLRTGPAPASVAEGPSEAASDRSGGQDALLSAWDAAFGAPEDESASRGEAGEGSRRRDRGDEPSLRELFWGEE